MSVGHSAVSAGGRSMLWEDGINGFINSCTQFYCMYIKLSSTEGATYIRSEA